MGTMNREHAEKLLSEARRLGASETYLRDGHVHVRMTGYSPARERVGDLELVMSRARSRLNKYWHAGTPEGVRWSRRAAQVAGQLDTLRLNPC